MTPDRWCRDNAAKLRMVAWQLYRRWPSHAVSQEDVLQELLVSALTAWDRFDPARGVDRTAYLVWSASCLTTKWLHRQRGDRSWKGQDNQAVPVSALALGADVDWFEATGMQPDEAASLLEAVRRILQSSREERARWCAAALVDGEYATDDWHARVLASRSVDMFLEVPRGEESRRGRGFQGPPGHPPGHVRAA